MAEFGVNRRQRLLVGAAVLAPIAAAVALRPGDHGRGGHDGYFTALEAALRKAGLFRPTLVINRGRLKSHLPANKHYRVVAKLLPSLGLIREARAASC